MLELKDDSLGNNSYQEMFPGHGDPYIWKPSYEKLLKRIGMLFDCDIDFKGEEE